MTDRAKTCYLRLSALTILLLLGAVFACRPAWSPDGKRLLFASLASGQKQTIAVYDRDSDSAEVLFQAQGVTAGAPLWTADGSHAVIPSATGNKKCEIVVVPVTTRGAIRRFPVDLDEDELLTPPVLLGRHLFVGGTTLASFDIDTGIRTEVLPAAADRRYLAIPAGDGLAYVRGSKADNDAWEVGRLDSVTGHTTPLLHGDPQSPWDVWMIPAFSPDGSRIAMLARSRDDKRGAILVFTGGKIEAELSIEGEARPGNVVWAPDSARLFATLARDDGRERHWSLVETMIGGSVMRETPIATSLIEDRRMSAMAMMFQVALSPDGRVAAMSTAAIENLPAEQHGLYLVDLTGEHKVRRVPFPAPPAPLVPQVVLVGSDTMLQLADAWSTAFADTHADLPIRVNGGGTGQGFAALLDGEASMLAMSTRPARPAELAAAQQRGLQLTEHRVAFAALAIGVHKDNPMTEITVAQLAALFGPDGATRWNELGIAMPDGQESIRAVATRGTIYQLPFQKAVLAGRPLGKHVENLNGTEVATLLGTTPNAIGIVPCDLADPAIKLLAVAGKAGDAAVRPTNATIADGSYPLAQPQLLYSRAEPSPPVNAFLQWLASEAGRKVTARAGFVPAD